MRRMELVAYAADFASLLLAEAGEDIDRIVLFGSVARGNFDEGSDVDVFVDTKKAIEPRVRRVLALFERSEARRKWGARGVRSGIAVQVGELRKWGLRRDVLSDGIVLYGKHQELPEGMGYYALVQPRFARLAKPKRVRLWRRLYGYRQKVGKKRYESPGLVSEMGGSRIESGILVPMEKRRRLLDLLRKERVPYTIREAWSDAP